MQNELPLLVAGPMLRRATKKQICIWLVTSRPLNARFLLFNQKNDDLIFSQEFEEHKQVKLGEQCFFILANFQAQTEFPVDIELEYDIEQQGHSLLSELDSFFYSNRTKPNFIIPSHANHIAHGSCRHPHFDGDDALVALDKKYAAQKTKERANVLIMSGDQIYADDVCGPLLFAIRKAIKLLGLKNQELDDKTIRSCLDLDIDKTPIYHRSLFLPKSDINHGWIKKWLNRPATPVFSSNTTDNHLISFNEFIAMYILVWSPVLWHYIQLPNHNAFPQFSHKEQNRWDLEKKQISKFRDGLPYVRRLFAHIPTYMMLDDHDITDDFNLTLGWERAVFNSPFAQNIITNGMLGYFFCQAWGNNPQVFDTLFWNEIEQFLDKPTPKTIQSISALFHHFEQWHYTIPTIPKIVVIDTRTRRWRSESSYNKPSGLMDWESLMDFQQDVFNNNAVIVVSPAPMFGVKFIESLQRMVTFLGHPLATDSENWMAHPGTANALLNIFKHPKTPKNFVILSGDVHYSFAYDIRLRFRKGSPKIWQITCSGFRNQFPEPFLTIFEWFDRKLFWPQSPLNIFTRRKRMKIERRRPNNSDTSLLVNQCAIGEVRLNEEGAPSYIGLLTAKNEQIEFLPNEQHHHELSSAIDDIFHHNHEHNK